MHHAQQADFRAGLLVVDDTPDQLRLLTKLLKEQGYEVRPVLNGANARSAACAHPPDLILLDIMMPNMDGYKVCRHLKADGPCNTFRSSF